MDAEPNIFTAHDSTEEGEFLFSVIVPVYNTQDYVAQAIESVLLQTIGFEEHVQLVLVDDGSTDSSPAICKAYRDAFPHNIVYVSKENEGVSIARRTGLFFARGTFVNFLDSDDYWSPDAFQCAADFLEAHLEVRVVAARHEFFGREGMAEHALSYKFAMDKIVDIREVADHPQLSLNNAFVARDLFDNNYFDPQLKVSEDFLVINEILLREHYFATLGQPIYYYRKRADFTSALDTSKRDLSWYFDTPQRCYAQLFQLSHERFGRVLPYIQNCVMYDLQWRLSLASKSPLAPRERMRYSKLIVQLLREIDDQIIVSQRDIDAHMLLYALALKYEVDVADIQANLCVVGTRLYWVHPDTGALLALRSIEEDSQITVDFIQLSGDSLVVEGCVASLAAVSHVRVSARVKSGQVFEAVVEDDHCHEYRGFSGNAVYVPQRFTLQFPPETFSLFVSVCGTAQRVELRFNKFAPLANKAGTFAHLGDYLLTSVYPYEEIEVFPATRKDLLRRETLCELRTFANYQEYWPYVRYRRSAFAKHLQGGNRIWLLSDRADLANDSGEALFAYLQEHPVDGVDTYFVLREDSIDYNRVRKIGKVVPFGSSKHYELALQAEAFISSAAEDYVFNPFSEGRNVLCGFQDAKFVFLQHGVIKDDLSEWLNRYAKDIDIFVTSAPREAASIYENPRYGYGPEKVLCSGLPRHDVLLAQAEKYAQQAELSQNQEGRAQAASGEYTGRAPLQDLAGGHGLHTGTPQETGAVRRILIAPTWRHALAMPPDIMTGLREPNPAFASSEYYRFYQRLINSSELANAARSLNAEVRFLLHPALSQELSKFSSPFCTIVSDYHYADELARASLLVTDYSSVFFDFALLGKPVVYTQFDAEDFFSSHTYERGYFDYERDGFGPVCTTYEETLNTIVQYARLDAMPAEYRVRAKSFFYWPDRPRCEIVVEAICNLFTAQDNLG